MEDYGGGQRSLVADMEEAGEIDQDAGLEHTDAGGRRWHRDSQRHDYQQRDGVDDAEIQAWQVGVEGE